MLTTLTAIGWITAPHVGIGTGLGGVLRTAALLWLVAHHVGFTVRGAGRIGMLPLGLVLLPGALLAMAGRWVVRAGAVTRLRHVGYAAVALALPYALLAGALAVASRTAVAAPSLLQAVVASFLLALVAGGLGAARGLAPWSRLASLLPRPAPVDHHGHARRGRHLGRGRARCWRPSRSRCTCRRSGRPATRSRPVRAARRCCCWPSSPTSRTRSSGRWPTRSVPGSRSARGRSSPPPARSLGAVPAFPMLAALPSGAQPGGPAWVPVLVLAMPYLAGVFAGMVTVRIAPTPVIEAAPLWGFAAGAAAGVLAGLAAAFSGGPLGDGRLAAVGPSGFQVGLVADPGDRRHCRPDRRRRQLAHPAPGRETQDAELHPPRPRLMPQPVLRGLGSAGSAGRARTGVLTGVVDETDDAGGHRIYFNPWAGHDRTTTSRTTRLTC